MRIFLFKVVSLTFFLLYTCANISAQEPESEKKWDIDGQQTSQKTKSKTNIELMHAEEGSYLTPQKSKEGILIFHGGIIIKIQNKILKAETVKINPETGEIYAEGNVTLTDEAQIIKGSSFIYDTKLQSGVLYDIKGYYEPIYIVGDKSKITSNENLVVSAAFLSTCKEESPHYYLRAKKIWLQSNNRFAALDLTYYVANVPIFYLPFLFQTDFGTGINTLFGYNDKRGVYIQNSYFYGFQNNLVLPEGAMFMLDYYQYDGLYFGTYMKKNSPLLKYDLDLGMAIQTEKEPHGNSMSNLIRQPDGSYKAVTNYLYEVNLNLNSKWNSTLEKDHQSGLTVNFEEYNSSNFISLFKDRVIPSTSLQALSTSSRDKYQPKGNLLWKLVYADDWEDNHLSIMLEKYQMLNLSDAKYYNTFDVLPSASFSKKWYIVKPTTGIFQGITQDTYVNTGIINFYTPKGIASYSQAYGDIKAGLSAYFPFFNWLGLKPSAGYGITGRFSNYQNQATILDDKRNTYNYIYSLDTLSIGPSFLKANIAYSLKMSINPQYLDPNFNSELENKVYFQLNSDFAPYGSIILGTARDLRQYNWNATEEQYWDPVYLTGFFDYDFINKDNMLLPQTMIPENYFIGVGLSESIIYQTKFNTLEANSLSLYFQTGGYQFWFFDRVKLLKLGGYWYHDFNNPLKNQIFLYAQTGFNFLKYWAIDFTFSSIAPSLGDSSGDYSRLTDYFKNNLNSSSSPFYINELSASLEHDLHDWSIRLTYSIRQSWLKFGTNLQSSAGYYEQSIYLLFNLKGLEGAGLPEVPITPFDPHNNPTQYGL